MLVHEPCIVGTIHEPFASLTAPEPAVTAKPLQLVLLLEGSLILGPRERLDGGTAAATVKRDNATSIVVIIVVVENRGNILFSKFSALRIRIAHKTCGYKIGTSCRCGGSVCGELPFSIDSKSTKPFFLA